VSSLQIGCNIVLLVRVGKNFIPDYSVIIELDEYLVSKLTKAFLLGSIVHELKLHQSIMSLEKTL